MFDSTQIKERTGGYNRILFLGFLVTVCLAFAISTGSAQTPTPTPVIEAADSTWHGYKVTAVTEIGWRWRSLDGNINKYRSDLNYKAGFRTFDSNLLLQNQTGKGDYFDSLLITNSGWGSDPTGATRVNMEKIGQYKFNGNIRRVTYFNNLYNFVNPIGFADSEHNQNIKHTFGDFDITFLPQNQTIRFTVGGSFNNSHGLGGTTERFFSDEFPIGVRINTKSRDFRVGAEGKLFGFDWGLSQGIRTFKDDSFGFLTAPNEGNNLATTGSSRLDTFSRAYPTDGHDYFTQFNAHRLFAKKLDVTARLIYSSTSTQSSILQLMTGKDNGSGAGILVTSDTLTVGAQAKRPQTRGDIGITYAATDKLRISNTLSFDQFSVNGGETSQEIWTKASGSTLMNTSRSMAYRVNAYKRYINTIEGDYQFNNAVGFHLGYRYTHRMVKDAGYDLTLISNNVVPAVNNPTFACTPDGVTQVPTVICEEEVNSTNTLIAGMKIKPVKNWSIFWDMEHGQADNVFTRVENYKFTNFRVRSRLSLNKVTFNLSAISKDNENPSLPQPSVVLPANVSYITNIKNRFFSGSVDWDPLSNLSVSAGYTYRHLTSSTPIIFPYSVCLTLSCTGSGSTATLFNYGTSQFFMHDHYGYVEVAARPMSRVSVFAAFRMDKDTGQQGLVSPLIPGDLNPRPSAGGVPIFANVIGGYPMSFITPEVRVAFRINRNIDWNVGYQYYNYKDVQTPFENYRAHLPFTSLRIYWGRAVDR